MPSEPFLRTKATRLVSYANLGKQVTTNKNNNVAMFSNGSLVTSLLENGDKQVRESKSVSGCEWVNVAEYVKLYEWGDCFLKKYYASLLRVTGGKPIVVNA